MTGGYLRPGRVHFSEPLINHLQQLQKLLVLIVKAASKENGTDDIADTAAEEEGGFDGGTWVMKISNVGGIE